MNQLAQGEPRLMKELVDAGKKMRTAQEQGGGEQLRDTIERHREALKELVARAEKVLRDAGRSPTSGTVDRVWETLRAGSVDPDLHDRLLAGRLDEEIEAAGFPVGLSVAASTPVAKGRRKPDTSDRARREAIREARDEIKERQAEVQGARKRVRDLEADEKKAHQAWERAVAQADRARNALAEAEEALADARNRAERLS